MAFGSELTITRLDPRPNDVATQAPQIDANQISQRRELITAVKALNQTELFGENNELTFALDRYSHKPVVRLVDRKTREVVRQIPSEQVLRMANEAATGVL
jgi:flagellar protein FlaG